MLRLRVMQGLMEIVKEQRLRMLEQKERIVQRVHVPVLAICGVGRCS